MRISRSTPVVFLLPFLLLMLAGCEENTVGPGTGSGALLETEINGVKYSMTPNVLQSSYTVQFASGNFTGKTTGTPTRSLTVIFRSDIDAGTYPRTLEAPDVSLVYIETTNGVDEIYNSTNATMTITGKSTTSTGSNVVAGTFSGTVAKDGDPTKTVVFTNGKFSVDLSRN